MMSVINTLQQQYEQMLQQHRLYLCLHGDYNAQTCLVPSWEQMNSVLTTARLNLIAQLGLPVLLGIGNHNVLSIAEGGGEVADHTRGLNYLQARAHCVAEGYTLLTVSEYMTLQALVYAQGGIAYDLESSTWLESNETLPQQASVGCGQYTVTGNYAILSERSTLREATRGYRRAVKIPL